MKIKVQDLTNEQLDEWVARAREWRKADCLTGSDSPSNPFGEPIWYCWWDDDAKICDIGKYSPTNNDAQAMALLKEFESNVAKCGPRWWAIRKWNNGDAARGFGETPNAAICRAIISSKFGNEVETEN